MPQKRPFNLFVYGTLRYPWLFRAVLGRRLATRADDADGVETFHAREAVLTGYKKISPDNTYLYAVPDPHGRIRGYLIDALPPQCMALLHQYEGRNYLQRRLGVQTKDGTEQAVVFVGDVEQLEHSFGYAFNDPLKQEVLLERKIEVALVETEREQLHTDESPARRAMGELHGDTIRDIVRAHFDSGGISDYAIRHSLKAAPLPDFCGIVSDAGGKALAPNYLALVIRQVLFNQFEDRIRREFRYELDHAGARQPYYERTVSSLAALQILNSSQDLLSEIVADCLAELSFEKHHLVDFVRWSILAADRIYDPRSARRQIKLITSHTGRGWIPLGAELEFSNIGHDVIRDPEGMNRQDRVYDGFLYFPDFGLNVLTWKLGGHIDDHHVKASAERRRGFFEVALGNLSIQENISKPVTNDPWLLNQFIHEARRFYPIRPHSVHISLQLRSQSHRPVRDRLLPLEAMKCLFAIAGDPAVTQDGLQIRRLVSDEIVRGDPTPHILFSEISRRHSTHVEDMSLSGRSAQAPSRYVQQFKFLRLTPHCNYEPIAMALKGLQLKFKPGSFLTSEQYTSSKKHRRAFEDLLAWGAAPRPISRSEIGRFLDSIREGLMSERRGRPAHGEAYIAWTLAQLRGMLQRFNCLARGEAARSWD